MTKKQLLKKLIYHYEWCIEYLPKKNWKQFIKKWDVEDGVCWCAYAFYNHNPTIKWVNKYRNDETTVCIWATFPIFADSRKECIELLTIRLNNLKKEYKLC